MKNHFSLLNLTPVYGIDLSVLETEYLLAQRKFHPDRFVGKPDAERQAALQNSVDINNAYHTLKDPLGRAQHLLHLQGITVGTDKDTVKPSSNTLNEAMELRENPLPKDRLDAVIAALVASIDASFAKKDFDAMAQETIRLSYLLKARK